VNASAPCLPGATIGVLGGGQLGRMLALAARKMGYRVGVFSPEVDGPAAAVADFAVVAPYDDLAAVEAFAARVDVVTFEFENVSAAAAEAAARRAPVRPAGRVLHTTQQRLREKRHLRAAGVPVTAFAPVLQADDLPRGVAALGLPCVLKTADFGYDGKGQRRLDTDRPETLAAAFEGLAGGPGILEAWVPFERELSIVAARGLDGAFAAYPPFENRHRHHILDLTLCPANVPATVAREAEDLARRVLESLDVVGLMCVEMFQLPDGRLLVNELAPRTHNSGHLTLEAAVTSQFEQQLRAVCGLPLGATETRPAAMVNVLGDLWASGTPDWAAALALPGVHLHLYGKREARPGRKMGHLTVVGPSVEAAASRALEARARLTAR
jgi:5-(carboxyamino)imidazole ribonucleotide synthase